MAQSKHRPKFKAKKKKATINKVKQKQQDNMNAQKEKENPVALEFHKDATTVTIPMNAWKTLVQCAKILEPLAMIIATMEQIGQAQVESGDLLPVYFDDTEEIPGAKPQVNPSNGQTYIPRKIKDSFWIRGKKKEQIIETLGKPTIVMADGVTVYDASKEEAPVEEAKGV